MLGEMSPERIEYWIEQLDKKNSALVRHATRAATADDDSMARIRLPSALAKLEPAEAGVYFNQDVPDIAESITFLLIFVCRRPQDEELNESANRAEMRIDMDEALGRRQQQFGYLEQFGRHDKAEGYYGLSCLATVQSSVDEAIKFLKDCSREVGNEPFSNSYVN